MNIVTILVTRSKACHVKTLHTVLRINVQCLQKNINNQITYVDDDPFQKAEAVQKFMKTCDRIIFIDFGIGLDDDSIKQCFEPHDTVGCLVFPGVKEGVDWGLFKAKIKDGSSEPVTQMGLHFDTEVGMKISEDIYRVKTTQARAWVMNTKNVTKGNDKRPPWGKEDDVIFVADQGLCGFLITRSTRKSQPTFFLSENPSDTNHTQSSHTNYGKFPTATMQR